MKEIYCVIHPCAHLDGSWLLVFFYIGKNVFKDRSDIGYINFFKSFNVGVVEIVHTSRSLLKIQRDLSEYYCK